MRALMIGFALLWGCGGAATGPDPAGATGDLAGARDLAVAAADLSTVAWDLAMAPRDLVVAGPVDPKEPGVQCKAMTCAMGDVCCVDPKQMTAACSAANACPPSSASFACEGPEDCPGGQVCCATIKVDGSGLNCTFVSGKAVCAATCQTMLAACPATQVVRLCHAKADCASDPGNKNCCELSPGFIGCISDLAKTIANPKCY